MATDPHLMQVLKLSDDEVNIVMGVFQEMMKKTMRKGPSRQKVEIY